jgi:hypothetical protein
VLVVARLALLAIHRRGRVKPLAGGDPCAEVLVIVAAKTVVVGQHLAVVDVAVVAVVLDVERGVARGQRTR